MHIKELINQEEWDSFAKNYPYAYFLQSYNWAQVNNDLGNKVYQYGIYDEDKLVGIFLGILQTATKGPVSYKSFILPAGPLIDYSSKDLVNEVFEFISNLAKKEGADFIRIRPPLLNTAENTALFANLGFKKAPMHLHAETTLQLDLTLSEEELLKQMRKTTRYSIRKAERDEVTIECTTDPNKGNIIYNLQSETVGRQHFTPFPLRYFVSQLEYFGKNNEALLYIANFENVPVAAALIVFFGQTAVYHLGASCDKYRNLTASQLIQWQAIKEAKKRGCLYYNFWGIIEEENQKHPWYGLSLFKKGFGGQVVKFVPAHDKALSWKYPAIWAFETLRRKKRGL